jgi:hypothetical protein
MVDQATQLLQVFDGPTEVAKVKAHFAKKREMHELQRLGLTMWHPSEVLGGSINSGASSSSGEGSVNSDDASITSGSAQGPSSIKCFRVSLPPSSSSGMLCTQGGASVLGMAPVAEGGVVQESDRGGSTVEAEALPAVGPASVTAEPRQAFLAFFQPAPGAVRYFGCVTGNVSPFAAAASPNVLRADLAKQHRAAHPALQQGPHCMGRKLRALSAPVALPRAPKSETNQTLSSHLQSIGSSLAEVPICVPHRLAASKCVSLSAALPEESQKLIERAEAVLARSRSQEPAVTAHCGAAVAERLAAIGTTCVVPAGAITDPLNLYVMRQASDKRLPAGDVLHVQSSESKADEHLSNSTEALRQEGQAKLLCEGCDLTASETGLLECILGAG